MSVLDNGSRFEMYKTPFQTYSRRLIVTIRNVQNAISEMYKTPFLYISDIYTDS